MSTAKDIIIIGTGLAGYTLAKELRKRDQDSSLLMITRDDGHSYSKPMLSNALDKGKTADTLVMATAEKMAQDLPADIWTDTCVESIDAAARTLKTTQGDVQYGKLVLANGASTINAPLSGDAVDKVMSVNDLQDYRSFRDHLEHGTRVVIIGAGLIGCEFANDLLAHGEAVSVIDLAPQPLGKLLPVGAAGLLQDKLGELGARWYLDNAVERVDHDADALKVTLKDGSELSADVVLSAIGLRPDTTLAESAGLAVSRGVNVDRYLQTSNEAIYALGDCAQVEDLTLPYVMPLMNAARALAATLASAPAGDKTAVRYPAMPVVVKTPAYPTVVCPSPRPADGEWQEEITPEGVRAIYQDAHGKMLGFALTGELVKERMALAKQLDDWLS